jgi:hypothetical protein
MSAYVAEAVADPRDGRGSSLLGHRATGLPWSATRRSRPPDSERLLTTVRWTAGAAAGLRGGASFLIGATWPSNGCGGMSAVPGPSR